MSENKPEDDDKPPRSLIFHTQQQIKANKPQLTASTPGGPALCKFIASHKVPYKDQAINLFLYVLLRHLAKKEKENTQEYKRAEDALKEILTAEKLKAVPSEALDNHNVSMEMQVLWQSQGKNPDGDDEVSAFFKTNNIDYLSPEQASHETLEETAQKYNNRNTPKPKPPTSTTPY